MYAAVPPEGPVSRTALRICPLCEATCGLTLTVEGARVTGARGDADDVFSRGFICPKGAAFGELDGDPDRLTAPLIRVNGQLEKASWAEAFDLIAARIRPVVDEHGPNAVGVVLGNPNVHTMAGALYPPVLLGALRTRSLFTASTVDQMPKHVSSGLLFGDPFAIPVPDLDRTDHLLLIGANPLDSNGSLCTAPDFPGKLKALKARGGTLTVVDPRRTRTAGLADRHLAIRPGADAALLAALAHVLFAEKLADPGPHLADRLDGLAEVEEAVREFTPEAVAAVCEVPAEEIREVARELASAPTAAVYVRVGGSTVAFGTLANWLVDVLNVLTGNLDRPGGALFPLSATSSVGPPSRRGFALGRWHSRVGGHPEAKGELPLAALAQEIATPGEGRVRALITIAANPVLSAPDGDRLDRALADDLELMISVDPYLNETSRHADVILPPPPPSRSAHFDFVFNGFAVRNQVRYTPAPVALETGAMDECEIHARLVLAVSGMHGADPSAVDDLIIDRLLTKAGAPTGLPDRLTGDTGPERVLDLMLRLGPYDGLTLAALRAAPHGIDLGPLRPRLDQVLRTRSGRVELLPPPIAADLPRLRAALDVRRPDNTLLLVGRRHLRSNNSWMHNLPALNGGSNRCTLQLHPQDAARLGVTDGSPVRIRGAGGEIEAPAELTETLRAGVVSLPHGWGHDRSGTRLSVASARPGANVNQLLDGTLLDPLSGTAVLNGFEVTLTPSPL
ncbi:molybdopterin-dependent oxidoreductase [Streptomyces sp. NBC_00237]|uniref:molybdopterin-dependent oxidoreductase n=1 Tax=Streptomyces sp. NBC_00237 TaxID=2975687 RepID=UPI0022505F1B|nr:molybdopterin-dependent oxidoreductase [Streptomyces sp. NBC_00237]MCX5202212.1 molybdopterin-dependent oxidoreductase [Streptomyces sp. NBC_00237]